MKKEKVIVIGAGMAGIMAGRTLLDAGYEVVVLEARDRVGGRTHTDHSLGDSVDLGGAWIHGVDGNPLTPLAEELNIETGHTDFLNRTGHAVQSYDDDGTPLDQKEYAKGLQLALGSFYLASGSELYDRPKRFKSFKDLYDHGLPKPKGLSRAAELGFKYQSLISTEYVSAADAEEIDYTLHQHVMLPGGDFLVHGGGFNKITDHLAAGLDIRTGSPVRKITTGASHVQIEVETEKDPIVCDRVVITVPLGVLQSGQITFDPPLPKEKQETIGRIGFGVYEKIAMRFDRFYWPKEPQRFNYMSTGEPSLFHAWLNIGHYTGEPIIVAYHSHRRAKHINTLSDDELLEQTLHAMQIMFGNNGFGDIPQPEAYVRTGWEHDPYSCGSYSFDRVGQRPEDRRTLAKHVDSRLFFAGEATHPKFYGTIHGAYETGIRAAQEIISAD